jgi:hypothetical protein
VPSRSINLERAVFMISIDVEMAWGFMHYRDRPNPYVYRDERGFITDLLGLFEKHGIKATWAAVGHLFLDRCGVRGGTKHPELVRPGYSWLNGHDWLEPAPCSDATDVADQTKAHPAWYGRDIIELIKSCKAPQEIGSHTFSHVLCANPELSVEAMDSDLNACRQVSDGVVPPMKSFVFPRDEFGHLTVVAQHQFTSFRGRPSPSNTNSRNSTLKLFRTLRLSRRDPVCPRWEKEGIWNFPATYFFDTGSGRIGKLPVAIGARAVSMRVHEAVQSKSLFHLWFHPHNLTEKPKKSLRIMDRLLTNVNRLRDKGRIENLTMGELAARLGTPRTSSSA